MPLFIINIYTIVLWFSLNVILYTLELSPLMGIYPSILKWFFWEYYSYTAPISMLCIFILVQCNYFCLVIWSLVGSHNIYILIMLAEALTNQLYHIYMTCCTNLVEFTRLFPNNKDLVFMFLVFVQCYITEAIVNR